MSNLKQADFAISSYQDRLDADEQQRLAFFRALWEGQACLSAVLTPAYEVPGVERLRYLARNEIPVLADRPVKLDGRALAEASSRMAAVMCEKGGFADGVCEELQSVDWQCVCGPAADFAGKYPEAYVEYAHTSLAQAEMSAAAISAGASAASLGLRALLEPIATAVMKVREGAGFTKPHPVKCPVCGCGATLAIVGASSETSGGMRELWCGQCGARWEYDRVRCARCGTRNQGHLHYYHIEPDEAHRIATCDECGGYIRTVFQENVMMPVSPDVEDVVMIKLDMLAAQHMEATAQE